MSGVCSFRGMLFFLNSPCEGAMIWDESFGVVFFSLKG